MDLENLAGPDNVEAAAEEEHRAYLVARAIELMQAELPAVEWRACQEYLVKGRPAAKVAAELGVTVNQVYLVKSRILRRLRAELEGLLD
jgi:RNA polymerase sigma-70 factor (ECF subfamily)